MPTVEPVTSAVLPERSISTQNFQLQGMLVRRSWVPLILSTSPVPRVDEATLVDQAINKLPGHDRLSLPSSDKRYSGILSCFFHGFSTRLLRSMLSARQTRRRVVRGRITSSI